MENPIQRTPHLPTKIPGWSNKVLPTAFFWKNLRGINFQSGATLY
jgi:hypothetical protein